MDVSTITIIGFIVFLVASIFFYKTTPPDQTKSKLATILFGAFIGTLGAFLGIYELVFKLIFGKTISQLENTIHGPNAIWFNVFFFGAWIWLFVHFNAKRIYEWWISKFGKK